MVSRVWTLLGVAAAAFLLLGFTFPPARAQIDTSDYLATMKGMAQDMFEAAETGGRNRAYFDVVANSGDPLYIAPLIDLAFFGRIGGFVEARDAIFYALELTSGQSFERTWEDYFTWASANNVALPPGYGEFKGWLLATLIDPQFVRFFPKDVMETAKVNLLEAVWGGVRVDGIPSLVNARQIAPSEALAEGEAFQFCRDGDCAYPVPDEYVFGVSLNGDNRAYPLRLLNWHEMFNDVIGRAPMFDQPDGAVICHFRAPTTFRAVARDGTEWVQVVGRSADCPRTGGWLRQPDIEWLETDRIDNIEALLPDLSETGAEALAREQGVEGRVGGVPVTLAYCTLCGSGILYETTIADLVVNGENQGQTVLEFGSTGLLMRSNKLMYDRTTDTVWNAMTGEPAFGPLADSGLKLNILPVVVTDWASWLTEHPDTSVLSLDTGHLRNYANGAAYTQYFNDPDFIMFPVWNQNTAEQANKEMVFALRINGEPKAYPLRTIVPQHVTNDTTGGVDVVIIAQAAPQREFFEPGGAAVRAYDRHGQVFSPGVDSGQVVDQNGVVWTVTEEALVSANGERLDRIAGHLAFWFGWYAFYPETLVYEMDSQ